MIMKKNIDLLKKLELETTNTGVIHLWQEGVFWKAYERSAYVFVQRISGYKPYKRFVRVVGGEVLAIGFPAVAFNKVTDGRNLEWVDGKHCILTGFNVEAREMKLYYSWKKEVPSFPYTVVEAPKEEATKIETTTNITEPEAARSEKKSKPTVPVPAVSEQEQQTAPAIQCPVADDSYSWQAIPDKIVGQQLAEELRRFRMETATPLDCMLFLAKLVKTAWEGLPERTPGKRQ